MTGEFKKELEDNGVAVEAALERFMKNEGLYERFLKKFLDDGNYFKLLTAVQDKDAQNAFMAGHTLKGVAGNLGLNGIMDPLQPMVETLRAGGMDGVPEAMETVSSNYEAVCAAIRKYM